MKFLLDNHIPRRVTDVLNDSATVRDVLSPDASDTRIYEWCRESGVAVFVTKDKQFAWKIAADGTNLKCILCMYGNISLQETVDLFIANKSRIEYFAKSPLKVLQLS